VLGLPNARDGDTRRIVSFSIFGATLYHGLPPGHAKRVFQVLDHQAIYLLIAGSYTPFTLVSLNGSTGWWMFGAIWGLALLGLILDALPQRGARVLPMVIYLVMGWLIVVAIKPLLAVLPGAGFIWLLTGGLFYTSGVLFYAHDHRYPWVHGVWHFCAGRQHQPLCGSSGLCLTANDDSGQTSRCQKKAPGDVG
jgi:hemolysin III